MKKLLSSVMAIALLASLAGCIVVPERPGYYARPVYYDGWHHY